MLVIDPQECIDCALCEPECPAEAIFADDALPDDQQQFADLNRSLSQQWPVISAAGDVPADAERWQGVAGKLRFLEGDQAQAAEKLRSAAAG